MTTWERGYEGVPDSLHAEVSHPSSEGMWRMDIVGNDAHTTWWWRLSYPWPSFRAAAIGNAHSEDEAKSLVLAALEQHGGKAS